MSLRAQLLLLSLLTLVLPWAGCRYAQQMETVLRRGQEESLLTTADVLAKVVAAEPELLYRIPEIKDRFDAERGDIFAPLLEAQPLVDGFPDEWLEPSRTVPGLRSTLRLGVHGRNMQLYVFVHDTSLRYETPSSFESLASHRFDRVIVLMRDDYGREFAWSLSAQAPGPLIVRACDVGSPWTPRPERITAVEGVWRAAPNGYAIELRAPIAFFGSQISVFAVDADGPALSPMALVYLHTASTALRNRIEPYVPTGTRMAIVDKQGWLLAHAGSVKDLPRQPSYGMRATEDGFLRSMYRPLLARQTQAPTSYGLPYGMWGAPVDQARNGEPSAIWFDAGAGEPSLVRAAVPLHSSNGELLGAVLVEQPGEQLIELRDRALNRLLNFTLLATLLAVGTSLLFAAGLSQRIRRLSRAAVTAVGPEGRIDTNIPGTRSRDEIGALARSFQQLLTRAQEYTSYLQTLGSKLSHELRTPLTIVSSSLDNLAAEAKLEGNAHTYLDRARQGATRLHALLSALSEATRVEQAIEHAERISFDLADLVRSMGQAYQQTFADHRVQVEVPDTPCPSRGAPELIAQLLDKLMDNAIDFTPAGGNIILRLALSGSEYVLSLINDGPLLPPGSNEQLFESLVSNRAGANDEPHLGLGLYIVRLIARFHGGRCEAMNRDDGGGVIMRVRLPRA
jgi:dedicated sortase system histidine kinase